MNTSPSDSAREPTGPERKRACGDPGGKIPSRPEDTTASGDAKNGTGEDNQRDKQ